MPGEVYRSRFQHWDEVAWVRSKPHRDGAFQPGLAYFSPALCPALGHPALRMAGERVRQRLLVHQLYLYLEFTVRLETGPVNEVCLLLRSADFLPWLPRGMKDDALRIYTDEAGHAEMSHTLLSSVATETGVAPLPYEPAFLRELAHVYALAPEVDQGLLTLFFVIVSETLITASLHSLPRDGRVQRQVREMAADHAADEGRHYAYFRQLYEYVWPRLDTTLRVRIGRLLPRMVLAFLEQDQPALAEVLADCGIDRPVTVAGEIATGEAARGLVREGAEPTLRMFARSGMFESAAIADAFGEAGLPVPGAR